MIKLIACIGRNGELGDTSSPDGLPWDREKEDMNYFRDKTLGEMVLLGRETYVGFQKMGMAKGLPNRKHYVITTRHNLKSRDHVMYVHDGMHLNKIMSLSKGRNSEDLWIIGGKSIYDQLWPYAEEVHLTRIDQDLPNADVILNTSWLDNYTLCDKVHLNDYSHVEIYKRK